MISSEVKSWVNYSLEEAADSIAKRASVAQEIRKLRDKSAAPSDYLKDIEETIKAVAGKVDKDLVKSTLIGAGGGAALGGASSLLRPQGDKRILRNMITGAIAGAPVGAGGYAAYKHFGPGLSQVNKTVKQRNIAKGKGKKPKFNFDTLSPEELAKVNRLTTLTPTQQAWDASTDWAQNYYKNHPIISSILAADAISHILGSTGQFFSSKAYPSSVDAFRRAVGKFTELESGDAKKLYGNIAGGTLPGAGNNPMQAISNDAVREALKEYRKNPEAGFNIVGANIPKSRMDEFAKVMNKGIRLGSIEDAFDAFQLGDQYRAGKSWVGNKNIPFTRRRTPSGLNAVTKLRHLMPKTLPSTLGNLGHKFSIGNNPKLQLTGRAGLYLGLPILLDAMKQQAARDAELQRTLNLNKVLKGN